ncbi:hypothetical protein NWFMUON74_64220 [Nocardia wallacei]|uniref:Uncharacterized protein n=1 Tax=Nocardia wallacei TaxID=480035 RepID=A0A7G1KTX5_9NOCA|nr:hypothetical protein NWFMUON74_64220 [Nocardia wallacei]
MIGSPDRAATSAANSGASATSHSPSAIGGSPSTCAVSVMPRRAPESDIMWEMRSAGYAGSTGRKAAPARATAHTARTCSIDRGIATATSTSGPAPRAISARASRADDSSSSA